MQAATAHLGGHPTQGAAFFKLSNSTPRQQLLLLAPNSCTQSLGQEPHTLLRKPHSTNNPFQLDSASLVVLPNTKNPTATPFSSDARSHCCKISLAPLEGLFPIPILNPLMVIKGFFNKTNDFSNHGIAKMETQKSKPYPTFIIPVLRGALTEEMDEIQASPPPVVFLQATNYLMHKDILRTRGHHTTTEKSATGGLLGGGGPWASSDL